MTNHSHFLSGALSNERLDGSPCRDIGAAMRASYHFVQAPPLGGHKVKFTAAAGWANNDGLVRFAHSRRVLSVRQRRQGPLESSDFCGAIGAFSH